jgi:hypothetical protein
MLRLAEDHYQIPSPAAGFLSTIAIRPITSPALV